MGSEITSLLDELIPARTVTIRRRLVFVTMVLVQHCNFGQCTVLPPTSRYFKHARC